MILERKKCECGCNRFFWVESETYEAVYKGVRCTSCRKEYLLHRELK
jgi:hypothetical protein